MGLKIYSFPSSPAALIDKILPQTMKADEILFQTAGINE